MFTMSFGIYKQSQGYWVRVLTAAFVGVIIIAAAAWGWGQAGTIRLPAREWTYSVNNVHGELNVGDSVTVMGYSSDPGAVDELGEIGTATISQYSPGKGSTANLSIENFSNTNLRDQGNDAVSLKAGDQELPSFTANVRSPRPVPIYPIEYLQAAVAGGVMLIGAITLYFFVGSKRGSVEFLIATDSEMKKVNWTTFREVKGSTIVVIVATFLIAGFLYGVDNIFATIFSAIGVLEN